MDFYLGVLAGGKSTRFGSNKCLYKMGGQTLISIILSQVPLLTTQPKAVFISFFKEDQVSQFVSHLPHDQIESSHDEKLFYLKPGGDQKAMAIPVKFVFDEVKRDLLNIRASIFGLASLLNEIPDGAYMQVIPCDTPFFNAKVMDAIHSKLREVDGQVDAFVPKWRNGFIEPLHTIYKKEMIKKIKENLGKKIFKLSSLLEGDARVVYFDIEPNLEPIDPSLKAFKNLNNPDLVAGNPDSAKK
jgi:molybdopterin-guanine dinucleotide biosynthesis protein A